MYARKRPMPTPAPRHAGKKPRLPAHARTRAALPFRLPLPLLTAVCGAQLLILILLFYVSR